MKYSIQKWMSCVQSAKSQDFITQFQSPCDWTHHHERPSSLVHCQSQMSMGKISNTGPTLSNDRANQVCVCSVSPRSRMEGSVRVSCIDHQSYQTNIPSSAENTMGIHFFHQICLISVISAVVAFWLIFRALLQFRVQFSSNLKARWVRCVPALPVSCLWVSTQSSLLVYPFAKTCKLAVTLTLIIIHYSQSRGISWKAKYICLREGGFGGWLQGPCRRWLTIWNSTVGHMHKEPLNKTLCLSLPSSPR